MLILRVSNGSKEDLPVGRAPAAEGRPAADQSPTSDVKPSARVVTSAAALRVAPPHAHTVPSPASGRAAERPRRDAEPSELGGVRGDPTVPQVRASTPGRPSSASSPRIVVGSGTPDEEDETVEAMRDTLHSPPETKAPPRASSASALSTTSPTVRTRPAPAGEGPAAESRARGSRAKAAPAAGQSGDGDARAVDVGYLQSVDEEAAADPLVGLVVAGRYRIVAPIGRGGMGIVYRVEHTRIGKLLAMKLLAGELSSNKDVVRRFKQEALTVSRLSSPYTVQVFDYGVWQHLTYLIMELVEGQDLSRALRRHGPLPFARVGRLMVHVCTSLGEAHGKGIVHRDIKPENIMIVSGPRGSEVAKVLDFGLAKLRENPDLNEVTTQGAVIGTPYYMSPEQVLGEEVDGRSDLYSLGAVMFRALTGQYPYQASTPMGMFTKHLTEPVPFAHERAPQLGIPRGVSEAVARCMTKHKADRFQTIEELREVLLGELAALGLPSNERLLLLDEREPSPSDPGLGPSPPPRPSQPEPVDDRAATDPAEVRGADRRYRVELAMSQIATRSQLEDYERDLRRKRYGAWALLALALGATAGALGYAWRVSTTGFHGREREPNDTAADATPAPLGSAVHGRIGQRIDATTGDRDFYVFDLPGASAGPTHLRLELTSLPNFALCAILYRSGFKEPLAEFCSGQPGQDLKVPFLRVDPGRYFVAILQDRHARGSAGSPAVLENVSDDYRVTVSLVSPGPGDELEPNDQLASAQAATLGEALRGTLGWVNDEDVFCVGPGTRGRVAWRVSDEGRKAGTVLEVTPLRGREELPLVRVHDPRFQPIERPRLAADVSSPWRSVPFAADQGAHCVRLRLAVDPWVRAAQGREPQPDDTAYTIEIVGEAAP
jgi:serine/threonine-protein kinase